jgi:urease beta subunit
MTPGEYRLDESSSQIAANAGRRTIKVMVKNTGDRPIQVGSHFHFFESNRFLAFDRETAYGMRLNIAAGTAVRFEPGEAKQVELVDFGGHRIVQGFSGLVDGRLDAPGARDRAVERARGSGFLFERGKNQ